MQTSSQPKLLPIPFADAGSRQSIPNDSQIDITAGRASYTDGFPPLTRTPWLLEVYLLSVRTLMAFSMILRLPYAGSRRDLDTLMMRHSVPPLVATQKAQGFPILRLMDFGLTPLTGTQQTLKTPIQH